MTILLLLLAGILIMAIISAVTAGRRNRGPAGRRRHGTGAGHLGAGSAYIPPDAGSSTWDTSSNNHHHGGHHHGGHHDFGGGGHHSFGGHDGGGSFGGGDGGGSY